MSTRSSQFFLFSSPSRTTRRRRSRTAARDGRVHGLLLTPAGPLFSPFSALRSPPAHALSRIGGLVQQLDYDDLSRSTTKSKSRVIFRLSPPHLSTVKHAPILHLPIASAPITRPRRFKLHRAQYQSSSSSNAYGLSTTGFSDAAVDDTEAPVVVWEEAVEAGPEVEEAAEVEANGAGPGSTSESESAPYMSQASSSSL